MWSFSSCFRLNENELSLTHSVGFFVSFLFLFNSLCVATRLYYVYKLPYFHIVVLFEAADARTHYNIVYTQRREDDNDSRSIQHNKHIYVVCGCVRGYIPCSISGHNALYAYAHNPWNCFHTHLQSQHSHSDLKLNFISFYSDSPYPRLTHIYARTCGTLIYPYNACTHSTQWVKRRPRCKSFP